MAEAKPSVKEPTPTKVRKPWQSGQYTVYLWEFLFGLLQDSECSSLITWTNKESKIFRINNANEIATLWGTVKNRPTMDEKKLLRALRYYYKTKILRKVKGHKGVYQFLSIPYETERCEQTANTSSKGSTPSLPRSSERSSTDLSANKLNCSVILPARPEAQEMLERQETSSTDCNSNDLQNCNRTQITQDCVDELYEYCSRAESSSEYSISSDGSTKSLEELRADLLNNDIADNLNTTDNMDFVFDIDEDNNVCNVEISQNGEVLDLENL